MTTAIAPAPASAAADATPDAVDPRKFGRFDVIPLDRTFVDEGYQRPLTSFVDRIVKRFDPALYGAVVLSDRATATDPDLKVAKSSRQRYATIDGQTRIAAGERIGLPAAPAIVFEGMSRADEASLFSRLQTQRRGMATYMRYRAALVAGDPEAVAIGEIAERHGYAIGTGRNQSGDGGSVISAIAAMEKAYRANLLDRVLGTIRAVWPDRAEDDIAGEIIGGMRTFFLRTKNVDDNRLQDRLAQVTPKMLKHRASALREGAGHGGNSPGYMADAILGVYMQGGRKATRTKGDS